MCCRLVRVLYHNDIVLLIGQDVLTKAMRKHADARGWIFAWIATVEDARWSNLQEVRADYPAADGVTLKSRTIITVFNVKRNAYRLLTNINYADQVVQALEVLTHADYDKEKWKERY